MTRDEAIAKAARGGLADDEIIMTAATFVDILRHLGMLKLDEPKSANIEFDAISRLVDACRGVPYLATTINEILANAGLRIVEK